MATRVLVAEYLALNSVDLSNRVKSASIALNAADVDFTNMGSGGWAEAKPGIKSGTITIEFFADEAASSVIQTLWTLFTGNTVFAFDLRGDNGARSTSNPSYTGNCFLTAAPPIQGGVGEAQMFSVTLKITGAVTRATS